MINGEISANVTNIDLSDPSDLIFHNECQRHIDSFLEHIEDMVNSIDDASEVQFTDKISSCDA